MNEPCNSCAYFTELKTKVDRLEINMEEAKKNIKELEINDARREEKINSILLVLGEIKTSIAVLGEKIDTIEKKPGKTYENLMYEVVKYIVVAAVAFAAAKLF